jgi:predicted DNA-binding transcriptional regulator AlpA
MSDILLLEEVSELTRLPKATLRFYRHRGDGGPQSFKLGNRVVYRRSDVEQWIQAQFEKTASGADAA